MRGWRFDSDGGAVRLGLDADVLLEVDELDRSGRLGEDRHGVRVPRRDLLALLHLGAVLDEERRAHLELVGVELVAALRVDLERAVLVEDDLAPLVVAHAAHVDELGDAVVLEDDLRDLRGRGRGSADVERTHRQLRAGLADGLRGDDADGRADLDLLAGREVASVALRAHSVLCVAGEAGADPDLLDAGLVDPVARLLVDDLVRRDDRLVRLGVADLVEGGPAKRAVAERHLDLVSLDDGLDLDAVHRVAVLLRDDHVLRDVDELARQVAGVSRL